MSEPTFYQHCDDPPCDLGYVEYTCPVCGERQYDYADFWFGRDDVYAGSEVESSCEGCGAPLVMRLDAVGFLDIVPKEKP